MNSHILSQAIQHEKMEMTHFCMPYNALFTQMILTDTKFKRRTLNHKMSRPNNNNNLTETSVALILQLI